MERVGPEYACLGKMKLLRVLNASLVFPSVKLAPVCVHSFPCKIWIFFLGIEPSIVLCLYLFSLYVGNGLDLI